MADTPQAPVTPAWVEDESICPCGKKAGPEFRYGLCDRHARATPPVALLRFGVTIGKLATRERTLRSLLAEWRRK